MGIVRFGPPTELMLLLQKRYSLDTFIESGTYEGSTAAWAASHFAHVITIEFSEEMYKKAVAQHGKETTIEFVFGDSRTVLHDRVPTLTEPAIFWLDAHWSGGKTYGAQDQCGLLDEIAAINRSNVPQFLFIDDARLFMAPPPLPNLIEHWPTIDSIISLLQSRPEGYYIVIFEDVVIAVPKHAKELLASHCQRLTTRAWEEYGVSISQTAIERGLRLIGQGIHSLGTDLFGSVLHRLVERLCRSKSLS